jgi:hypothetical protein
MDNAVFAIDAHLRIVSDKTVPAPALAVFHTFQQIAMGADIFDDAQHFDGSTYIGIYTAAQGYNLIGAGIFFYFFQRFHKNLLYSDTKKPPLTIVHIVKDG